MCTNQRTYAKPYYNPTNGRADKEGSMEQEKRNLGAQKIVKGSRVQPKIEKCRKEQKKLSGSKRKN